MLPIYRDTGSRIHSLHPYVITAFVLSVFSASLVTANIWYMCLLLMVTVIVAVFAKILRNWASVMRFALYLSLSILIIDLIILPKNTWLNIYGISIPVEPVMASIPLILRLLVSIGSFLILSLAVNPDDILNATSGSKVILAVAMGSRLYPLIAEDEAEIEDIMRVRGVEMDAGGRIEKIRNRGLLLLPLLTGSLERGLSVAESMESRSFSGRKGVVSAFHRSLFRFEKLLLVFQTIALFLLLAWIFIPPVTFPLLLADFPDIGLSPAALISILLYLSVIAGGER